jgi:hypothetical protein
MAFWEAKGILLFGFLDRKATVNADHSSCTTLQHLKEVVQMKRSGFLTEKLTLLCNSAYPNTADVITQLLEQFHFECLALPPSILDLVPSNFHLIGQLKKNTEEKHFQCDDEINAAVRQWVQTIRSDLFSARVEQVVYHSDKCLSCSGDYVEK